MIKQYSKADQTMVIGICFAFLSVVVYTITSGIVAQTIPEGVTYFTLEGLLRGLCSFVVVFVSCIVTLGLNSWRNRRYVTSCDVEQGKYETTTLYFVGAMFTVTFVGAITIASATTIVAFALWVITISVVSIACIVVYLRLMKGIKNLSRTSLA